MINASYAYALPFLTGCNMLASCVHICKWMSALADLLESLHTHANPSIRFCHPTSVGSPSASQVQVRKVCLLGGRFSVCMCVRITWTCNADACIKSVAACYGRYAISHVKSAWISPTSHRQRIGISHCNVQACALATSLQGLTH